MFLLESLLAEGFCPNLIRTGRRIKFLSIEELNIKILASHNYFSGNEFCIAKLFNIKFEMQFFPYSLLLPSNLKYNGTMPNTQHYFSKFDSEELKEQKREFCRKRKGTYWCLLKELLSYSEFKLHLLVLTVLSFLKESMTFQTQLQSQILKLTQFNYLHPFGSPIISLSGFIYTLFRILYLNKFDIRVVKYEYGFPVRKVSRQEFEWTSYWIHKHPTEECYTAFNNPQGQKYFPECVPDLYCKSQKSCFFYNGCWAHKHYDNCLINPLASESTLSTNGTSYKAINEQFWNKLQALILNNPEEVDSVTVVWECQFKTIQKTQDYQYFEKNILSTHPLARLTSRDCYRGAYFDVCAHKWSMLSFPEEKLYFLDVNGLYSYATMKNPYMVGPYQILIGSDLQDIKINNKKLFYGSNKIFGALLLTIIPPRDLLHPFLLYKKRNNLTVLTLCKVCCETLAAKCTHSDLERAFTGSYMISEIEFALELNYQIVEIFECHAYFESNFIFKPFVEALDYYKQINSCSKKFVTEEICENLNEPESIFKFERQDFHKNLRKRNFYKLAANALFGKIAQRNNFEKNVYVSSQDELEKLYFSGSELKDIHCLNDQLCQVSLTPSAKQLTVNRNSNCYLGAQITAYAREKIYRYIQQVTAHPKATLYYVDCDCLVFSLPKAVTCPLPLSQKCGDFKFEYSQISTFFTLGIKSYFLTHFENKKAQQVCKIKGLSLLSMGDKFNELLFDSYIEDFLSNKNSSTKVAQVHRKANFKTFKTYFIEKNVTFSNKLTSPRIIKKDTRVSSIPFGYRE